MTDDDNKHLREVFDIRLEALERSIEEQFKNSQIALVLGAKETERRLDLLNHDGARRGELQATFVSRIEFEGWKNITELKLESLQRVAYVGIGAVAALQLVLKYF